MSFRKIKIARSSHRFCFVCLKKDSSNRLKSLNFESIIYGYKTHKIFIKKGSRCCRIHLDKNYNLKKDLFKILPTKLIECDNQILNMLDSQELKEETIFQKFKDTSTLDEKHCKEITGWSKEKFITFSKFITSVNDNLQRTKDQLIALYRYWLSTGSNQKTLASLFSKSTTQVQISNYLSVIRDAIHKDFVPFFLGSKKNRNFYLKHNNIMVKKLYNLEKDVLAIVCDGTYTRLEKSSSNSFQYRCWSSQKSDSLLKPFIICCADGWIIDCYGAFQASDNDAQILKYILKTDLDLRKILLPNKTMLFLDRGK